MSMAADDPVLPPQERTKLRPLPQLIFPVEIDGRTQQGWFGPPLIELDGSQTSDAWGLLLNSSGGEVNALAIAERCADSFAYRDAAASLGLSCPPTDFPPMAMRTGTFDPLADAAHQNEETTEGAIR